MSTGRKISVRKIIQTVVTLIAVTGCAMAMLSADRLQRNRKVRDVELKILSPGGVQFLTEDFVRSALFAKRHTDPTKISLAQLDERSMEAILQSNPWVREAQVFTDAERIMHIKVVQRVPVVRLFEEDGNSYYLDAGLQSMPLSSEYTHYTPVVTGVPRLRDDSAGRRVKGTVAGLVQHVSEHPFWKAQVSQIDMRADGGFDLIPLLGNQRIILGDTSRLEEKLGNLFNFYRQVQNKVGWDKYTTIDLRYKGQVVASPALRWKVPVDRAISNMNWLKAIMESAPVGAERAGAAAPSFPDTAVSVRRAPAVTAAAKTAAKPAARPAPKAAARTPAKAQIAPKSPAAKKAKLPQTAAKKKPATTASKNTTRHEKNTKSHAATNR